MVDGVGEGGAGMLMGFEAGGSAGGRGAGAVVKREGL